MWMPGWSYRRVFARAPIVWLLVGTLALAACAPEEPEPAPGAPAEEERREVFWQAQGLITAAAVSATADANIIPGKATFNAGAGTKIAVGNADRRGLIRFGSLPS